MPSRLEAIKAQLREVQSDLTFNKLVEPKEVEGLAKLSKAIAIIKEAQADFAEADLKKEGLHIK